MAKKKNSRVANNKLIRLFVLLALVLLATSGYLWLHFVRGNPEQTFWGAINNSLSTTSVVRSFEQNSDAQGQSQSLRLLGSPTNQVQGSSHIYQKSSGGSLDVITDLLGTPKTDYVRYKQLTNTAKKTDYSELQKQWGRSDAVDGTTSAQLYNQIVLGVIPFANLSGTDRQEILTTIKTSKAYNVDFSKVKKSKVAGRPTYNYDATLNTQSYVTVLKDFARKVGLTQLEQVNPQDYANSQPVTFSVTVDVWSREITKIDYTSAGRTEYYTGYGAYVAPADVPNTNVTLDQLQSKLQGQ